MAALRSLMNLVPDTATVVREGTEVSVPVAELKVGDIVLVRPASRIPVDGIVVSGASTVSEPTRVARIVNGAKVLSVPPETSAPSPFSTGIDSPVKKGEGAEVSGGT